jgi:hypothetical protein
MPEGQSYGSDVITAIAQYGDAIRQLANIAGLSPVAVTGR